MAYNNAGYGNIGPDTTVGMVVIIVFVFLSNAVKFYTICVITGAFS